MKSVNLRQLIRKGRVRPITKIDDQGKEWIVAFERKPGSKKAGQRYNLPKPIAVGGPVTKRDKLKGEG